MADAKLPCRNPLKTPSQQTPTTKPLPTADVILKESLTSASPHIMIEDERWPELQAIIWEYVKTDTPLEILGHGCHASVFALSDEYVLRIGVDYASDEDVETIEKMKTSTILLPVTSPLLVYEDGWGTNIYAQVFPRARHYQASGVYSGGALVCSHGESHWTSCQACHDIRDDDMRREAEWDGRVQEFIKRADILLDGVWDLHGHNLMIYKEQLVITDPGCWQDVTPMTIKRWFSQLFNPYNWTYYIKSWYDLYKNERRTPWSIKDYILQIKKLMSACKCTVDIQRQVAIRLLLGSKTLTYQRLQDRLLYYRMNSHERVPMWASLLMRWRS